MEQTIARRAISYVGDQEARNALLTPTKTPNKIPLSARITIPTYKLACNGLDFSRSIFLP